MLSPSLDLPSLRLGLDSRLRRQLLTLAALVGASVGVHAHSGADSRSRDESQAASRPPPRVLQGSIHINDLGAVKIHTYVSPAQGFLVDTHVVEGPTQLILFDGQLLKPYAQEVASYAEGLGKPINRIIVSHAHPDHWSGLQILTARFPRAPIYALPEVAKQIETQGDQMLEGLRRAFGDQVASTKTVPTEILQEGPQTLDGIRFDFRRVADAEADVQLLALLPDQKALLAFDLLFSPQDHVFTVVPHFDHWIEIIDSLKKLGGYEFIFVGHGKPTNFAAYAATISYLRKAKEIYATAETGAAYAQALKSEFPDRSQPNWADFSGRILYSRKARP